MCDALGYVSVQECLPHEACGGRRREPPQHGSVAPGVKTPNMVENMHMLLL